MDSDVSIMIEAVNCCLIDDYQVVLMVQFPWRFSTIFHGYHAISILNMNTIMAVYRPMHDMRTHRNLF